MLSLFMKNALIASVLLVSTRTTMACTLFCSEDEGYDAALPLVIESALPIPNCGAAKNFEGLLVSEPLSQFCDVLNGMKSACGCPPPSSNPCNMCPDGGKVSDGSLATLLEKPDEAGVDALKQDVDESFPELWSQAKPSCGLVEAFSQSLDEGSAGCTTMTNTFAGLCGCAGGDGDGNDVTVQTEPPVAAPTMKPVEATVQTDPPVPAPTMKPVEATVQTDPPVPAPTDAPDTSGGAGMTITLVSSVMVYFAFLLI